MKKSLITFLLFTVSTFIFSQEGVFDVKLTKVDKIIHSYNNIKSINHLVEKIDYDFETNIEKARAVYTWIALNIAYENSNVLFSPEFLIYQNKESLKRLKDYKNRQTIVEAFETKKAVCLGYALLFNKVCNALKIKNELIYGYTRSSVEQIGKIVSNKNHVWNAVYVENEWKLIDLTYGAGYNYRGVWQKYLDVSFFDVNKDKLRLTHFPSKVFWRKYLKQKPLKEFCNDPFFHDSFLTSNIEIITPKLGEIKVKKREKLYLKLKGIDKKASILYTYSNDKYLRVPHVKNTNSTSRIYFKKPKENTNLNIYVNNELVMQYKVLVE
ncbi:hypothetical protein DS884_09460 [Tenacibaculum sp. E3R01]|uniref:transglutaminase domain-containing protein n=1 Tax=unclassified Tenacibaculum TaxID=2635139 RepID=UPI000898E869|nr:MULTISPECIES: transglutaminase domain-containing protein [unclassified Tenacibaculum]RBW58085.1 hypothetical protein DS884_09460 [Tenacibaculum sp. E3R01]SED60826.1 Transglutaminase-like superfamily protein [Tenacibaculum sp. MAR_2010_89]